MNYLTTHIPGDIAHAPLTVGDTAVQIDAFANANTEYVQIAVEGDVRVTYDGTIPTTDTGYLYYDGHIFYLPLATVEQMQFISAQVGSEVTLRMSEFVPNPLPSEPTWKSINWLAFLHKVARRRQVDIQSGAFSREWVGLATEFIGSRLREVWGSAEWPVTMVIDERYYPDGDDRYIPGDRWVL